MNFLILCVIFVDFIILITSYKYSYPIFENRSEFTQDVVICCEGEPNMTYYVQQTLSKKLWDFEQNINKDVIQDNIKSCTKKKDVYYDETFKYDQYYIKFLSGEKIEPPYHYGQLHKGKYKLSGNMNRPERFDGLPAVSAPMADDLVAGRTYLELTDDLMQNAVNAFFLIVYGNDEDIKRLPREYVLKSIRTIEMMKLNADQLNAIWDVVKGNMTYGQIPYEILEIYRPLFKHLRGSVIASLNLTNERIAVFIGSHPGLNRHQISVVATRYRRLYPNWNDIYHLNIMRNIICGLPIIMLRHISHHSYLNLNADVFHHVRSCDKLQKRHLLRVMSETRVFGKAYGWSPAEVSRLGLLLSELSCENLRKIPPASMVGMGSQMVEQIPIERLGCITNKQITSMMDKPRTILLKRKDQLTFRNDRYSDNRASLFCGSNVFKLLLLLVIKFF